MLIYTAIMAAMAVGFSLGLAKENRRVGGLFLLYTGLLLLLSLLTLSAEGLL